MRVQDIMDRRFAALQADDGIDRIAEVFSTARVSSAPVFSKGDFIGMIGCADLVRFFNAREGMAIPFLDGSQKASGSAPTASAIARKPPFTLTPDQPVQLALGKIASSQDCVPVMDGKKVVGVVRPEALADFFLAERAKDEVLEGRRQSGAKKQTELDNSTAIDSMLEIVKRDGSTTPKKVAKELGITQSTAEDLAKLLGKHKLVDISYSFMAGMVMRRIGHGGK